MAINIALEACGGIVLRSDLIRSVSNNCGAMHMAGVVGSVIGLRYVHRTPVIPEHEIAFLPFVAVNEIWRSAMRMQIGK